ncbi:hypothetical protein D0469_04975 [Peribacillus saganii]|uniref:Uncharacterized protein n=1 Tax=Peribacillus saganii TaxID=2303992 RepID=A0A372LRF5_9BACI|nr:hypothetical protein [Peribacillus saganii]RFU70803.1 hypothetical protein D0469_04975 [Peribacillus saganii]
MSVPFNQAGQSLQQFQQRAGQQAAQGFQAGGFTQQAGGFGGLQSVMQPGFAGTDSQQVRQEIQQDLANQSMQRSGGFGQQAGGMMQSNAFGMGTGGFGGVQSVMQPGFAGTDAQQVRQEIQQDLANRSMQQGGFTQQAGGFAPMGGFTQQAGGFAPMGGFTQQAGGFAGGAQSVMQPGFAGTDAQQVRQEIQQDLANQSMQRSAGGFTQQAGGFAPMGGFTQQAGGFAPMSGYTQQAGGFGGMQSVMQPGFAGTDAQQVRQEIQQDLANQSMQRAGGYTQQAGGFTLGGGFGQQAGGAQAGMFAGTGSAISGTDAQQVRQEIQQDLMNQSMQQQGGFGQQAGFTQQAGFGQAGMFAGAGSAISGTNAQQVRQEIAQDLSNASQQGFMR